MTHRWASALGAWLVGCAATVAPGASTPPSPEPPPRVTVSIRYEHAMPDQAIPDQAMPEGAAAAPTTTLRLVLILDEGERRMADIGEEHGICSPSAPAPGQIAVAQCWWAGQGATLIVRRFGDALIVSRQAVDAEAPDGPEIDVARVPLPSEAEVRGVGLPPDE